MPESNANFIVPLRAISKNWEKVTKSDLANAQRTLNLAGALNRILGNHFSLMDKPQLVELSTLREMTDLVASNLKRSRWGRNKRTPSQIDLVQPLELAERVGFATGRKRRIFADILTRTIDDCYAVLEAGKLIQQGKEPKVLTIEVNNALMNLSINNPDILELLNRGVHTLTHVEREVSLADARSLVIALGLEEPKRDYIRKESTKVEEIAKPKKFKRELTKPVEAVVSTLPGVSYLIEGNKRAKPLNRLNRMGKTSADKLTKALEKCLKSKKGFVDVTKGNVMFMNLITRSFIHNDDGSMIKHKIMLNGNTFVLSKPQNLPKGFRINLVK